MNNDLFSVKDKIIVITGGGQGIGEFLALELSKRGANIFCVDKKFKKTKERIALHDIICDVTNLHDIKKTCMEIFKTNQRIDVLINNAGITLPENSDSYSLKSWQKTLDVNLTGAFLFSQKVLNLMKRNRSGSIINITSINAEFGFPNNIEIFFSNCSFTPLPLGHTGRLFISKLLFLINVTNKLKARLFCQS